MTTKKPKKQDPNKIEDESWAIVVDPRFVKRVGYPKSVRDYEHLVNKGAVTSLVMEHGDSVRHFLGSSICESKVIDEITRSLSWLLAKKDGFGGNTRDIHFVEVPELKGVEVYVSGFFCKNTGTRRPERHYSSWSYGEQEYDPPSFDIKKRWKLAYVSVQPFSVPRCVYGHALYEDGYSLVIPVEFLKKRE